MKKVMGGCETEDTEEGTQTICISCTSDIDCDYRHVCRSSPSCTALKVCALPLWC